MSELDKKTIFKKHAPSTFQFFFRGGLILLTFWVGGILYGQFLMDVPSGLTAEEENQFRLGVGFGLGLYLAIIPIVLLCLHYVYELFRAKKRAERDVSSFNQNKVKGRK